MRPTIKDMTNDDRDFVLRMLVNSYQIGVYEPIAVIVYNLDMSESFLRVKEQVEFRDKMLDSFTEYLRIAKGDDSYSRVDLEQDIKDFVEANQ